jgi:hypothetical protein
MKSRKEAKELFIQSIELAIEILNSDKGSGLLYKITVQSDIDKSIAWKTRRVYWSWDRIYNRAKKQTREAVISMEDTASNELVGLCAIKVTKGRITTKLLYAERNAAVAMYKGHVLPATILLLEMLGSTLGTELISIDKPLPDLVNIYREYGFVSIHGKNGSVVAMSKTPKGNFYVKK